jgi:hypothetical protein
VADQKGESLKPPGRAIALVSSARPSLPSRIGLIGTKALGRQQAECTPASPLSLRNPLASICRLWARRQAAVETTSTLAGNDPDGARLALPVACTAGGPFLVWQGRSIASQTKRAQLAAVRAHPAAVIGTPVSQL